MPAVPGIGTAISYTLYHIPCSLYPIPQPGPGAGRSAHTELEAGARDTGLALGAQGKVEGDCFVVLDAFALPVEGTETRVNAQQEAYEYIIDFAETNKVRGTARRALSPK